MLREAFRSLALLLAAVAGAQTFPQNSGILKAVEDQHGSLYVAGAVYGATGCTNCNGGFVVRLDPVGYGVIWVASVPGAVNGLAVAPDGAVYVAAATSSPSPLPVPGGYRAAPASILVEKFAADSGVVLAATYFGGTGPDEVGGLQLDSRGSVFLFGSAYSNPFPTTPGASQRERSSVYSPTEPFTSGPDQFVAAFDPSLSTLLFSTLAGVAGRNTANSMAFGPDGSIYLAGTRGKERLNRVEGLVNRISSDGRRLLYSALTGAKYSSGAYALAVDRSGYAYVATDNRVFPPPTHATLFRIDPWGTLVLDREVPARIESLDLNSDGELILQGRALGSLLPPTPGAPGACTRESSTLDAPLTFDARFDAPSLDLLYLGYSSGLNVLPLGPGRALVGRPYATTQSVAVLPVGMPPVGTVTCLASSANRRSSSVAPGELVSLSGIGLGTSVPIAGHPDAHGFFPLALGGYNVLVNGLPAPMLSTRPGRIDLVVPFGIDVSVPVHFELRRDSTVVAAFDKSGARTAAGFFESDGSPLVLNEDGSRNSAANPAAPGSAVTLFGTGFGKMEPAALDGSAPASPVSKPALPFRVFASDRPVALEYLGNAPTLVQGVVQVNLRMPTQPVANGKVTVSVGFESDSARATVFLR